LAVKGRRALIPKVIPATVAVLLAAACQGTSTPPAQPVPAGPPAIPDAQPAVDAPLFLGQNAFAAPISDQADYAPLVATARSDGGNTGVVDGPAPLGQAPVTCSAATSILAPMLWGHRGLTAGCQVEVAAGLTKPCLAAVDTANLTVTSRWLPPGQDLNLSSAVVDDADRIVVTTRQGHLFVVTRPDGDGPAFRVVRDIDLSGHLTDGQGLLAAVDDSSGNLWFTSGGPVSGPLATSTTVGLVTALDQVVTVTLADQRVETGLAVDQANVYLATAPAGPADHPGAQGTVYDLAAASGQIQTVWREQYDAGSGVKPGATTRGTGSPVVLLGSQYLAITDNADGQSHLLVFLRGPQSALAPRSTTSTSAATPLPTASTAPTSTSPTTAPASQSGGAVVDPRLVCNVALFGPGASAVTAAPIGYSSADTTSVIVANGYNTPAPPSNPSDDGPANDDNQMAPGVTRIDVLPDGSGCRAQWTTPLRLTTGPVLSVTTGLVYGYTQDESRAAAGSYVWYFVAVDYRTGRIVWRQRSGAGSTKNDDRQPMMVGANGVLYQIVPLGLVWMRDVTQQP
jgi:hypothetical protein